MTPRKRTTTTRQRQRARKRVIAMGRGRRADWRALIDSVVCSDALALLKRLPDGCIDLVVTSPPYDNLRKYNGFTWDFEGIARELYRVTKPGGVVVWVVGDSVVDGSETLTSFRQALYFNSIGFKVWDTMIWSKENTFEPANVRYYQTFEYMFVFSKGTPATFSPIMKPNKKAGQLIRSTSRHADGVTRPLHGNGETHRDKSPLNNVWSIQAGYNKTTKDKDAYEHPAMFPERLAENHILSWSNAGDIVFDCFMGSGTTALMARKNGRHYIGCDISAEYVALAQKRLAKPYALPLFADVA